MFIRKSKLSKKYFLEHANNELVRSYLDELNALCDKFKGTPITSLKFSKFRLFDETGDRANYENDFFEKRNRLTAFMLRVWLYGEESDACELEDVLWALCDEYTWALPAHLKGITANCDMPECGVDLFASETAHTVAETLALCGELLHPRVVSRCIEEINKRVFEPFETEEYEKYGLWWENIGTNNWSAVCGGAIGMAAIYLIEDEKRLKKIIRRCADACNRFFGYCAEDGVCKEGVTYWMYAMQYYVAFDELLLEYANESIVPDEIKMKKIAEFPSIACLGHGKNIMFSDALDNTVMFFGILCKLAERYDVPIPDKSYYGHFTDSVSRACGAARNVAWFNASLLHDAPRTDDVFLPVAEWALLRKNGMSVLAKGGHNGESHNHNDIGTYIFTKGDFALSDDLGSAKYTKDYFDNSVRFDFFNTGSQGHSVPIVNGRLQEFGEEYKADKFEKTENGVSISLAGAYGKDAGLKTLVRELDLGDAVTVKDTFEFCESANTVTERVITKLDARVSCGCVEIYMGDKTVGKIKFPEFGKINISHDSYLVHRVQTHDFEYNYDKENGAQNVTVIDFECSLGQSGEICYTIE